MREGLRFAVASVLLTSFTVGCSCVQKQWGTGAIGGALAGAAGGAIATGAAQNNTGAFDVGNDNEDRALAYATGVIGGALLGGLLGHCIFDDAPPLPVAPPPPAPPAPPVQQKIVLRGVNFDFDKAAIRADAVPVLKEAAEILKSNPSVNVAVNGYTDAIGSEAYNLKLSVRRADAVRNFLVGEGIAAGRLTTHGFGKANPVATNETEDGRAQNRRVELKVQ